MQHIWKRCAAAWRAFKQPTPAPQPVQPALWNRTPLLVGAEATYLRRLRAVVDRANHRVLIVIQRDGPKFIDSRQYTRYRALYAHLVKEVEKLLPPQSTAQCSHIFSIAIMPQGTVETIPLKAEAELNELVASFQRKAAKN